MTRALTLALTCAAIIAATAAQAPAVLMIYVINTDASPSPPGPGNTVIDNLESFGYEVDSGDFSGITSINQYDQVWDMRFETPIATNESSAFQSYLQQGGRMYLTGEYDNSTYDDRNDSLIAFLDDVGAGPITNVTPVSGNVTQDITTAGEIVNSPNDFDEVVFHFPSTATVAATSQGFLVTEYDDGNSTSHVGSLLGWDFGDIGSAPGARMLVGFDVSYLWDSPNSPDWTATQAKQWTQNMATFLATPEPSSLIVFAGLGLCGAASRWRKKKRTA